jgi:MFS family permease
MASEKASDEERAEIMEGYSVFSPVEKWCIVAMVSYAAWFSTLSSFIYYPAIHQLSQTFSVSVDKINLTVTSYMAMATVAPTLAGDAADVLGRRPVYLIALSLYIGSNMAVVLSDTYSALLGLRVLQALAISGMLCVQSLTWLLMIPGTFSIAYGVVTDIASPAERGSFVSAVSFA